MEPAIEWLLELHGYEIVAIEKSNLVLPLRRSNYDSVMRYLVRPIGSNSDPLAFVLLSGHCSERDLYITNDQVVGDRFATRYINILVENLELMSLANSGGETL